MVLHKTQKLETSFPALSSLSTLPTPLLPS